MNDRQTDREAIDNDHYAGGQFRTTHICVRADRRWLIAGMHLSPIGAPAPFARPPEQTTSEGTPPTGASGR